MGYIMNSRMFGFIDNDDEKLDVQVHHSYGETPFMTV